MEVDGRELGEGTRLEADVCIVGAGPAGITMARELVASGVAVILLESGGAVPDDALQALNDGVVVGSLHHGIRASRHRQVGGTAHLWNTPIAGALGAKYAPLDHIDLEKRDEVTHSGWPFGRAHIDPFYRRAQGVCGLGTFDYEAARWSSPERPELLLPAGDDLATRVYHAGPAHQFTTIHRNALRAAENIRLVHRATCCALITDGAHRVVGAVVRSSANTTFRVDARFYVLAAGALENARLLLASRDRDDALGNQYGWVGRCFMEHPRDYALRLVPRSPAVFRDLRFYDLHSREDAWIIGRVALDESVLRAQGLPNASLSLLPRPRRRPWLEPFAKVFGGLRQPGTVGYGWSEVSDVDKRCDAIQVLINLEQHPHPDNRVVLSSDRDSFGVPRAELHWRWREEEQSALRRLRVLLADRLNALGLGRVEIANDALPDPNSHHHAGTTRMSVDPRDGVVDADCKVHGSDNLYVTGGSVFPTAGFANPTLTIVALALRLADHLEARL